MQKLPQPLYQALLQNLMEGIHIMDIEGNVIEVNDAFCKMLGYTREEALRLNVTDWDAQWSATQLRESFESMVGKSARFETVQRCKDGKLINVEISAYGIELNGKRYFLGTSRDITERKRAEEALRQNAERLDLALNAANEGMWDMDAGTGQLYFSTNWGQLFGYKPEEIPKHIEEWKALIHPDDKDRVLQELNEHLQGRAPYYQSEYRIRSRSGAWVWVLGHGRVTSRDHHNNPLRVTGTTQDITDRKRADEELRIAATAFETQDGMMITDAHSVILRVNHAFTEITGYAAEEAVGQTPSLLKSGRHDAAFYAAMWGSIQRTGAWRGEIWNRRKNGEVYPERLSITAVKEDNGEITHHVATMHDITKRKQAEAEIHTLAFYDTLTQLPNRRLLNDRLKQTMPASKRSGRYGALMFLDLDNFKTLNDTHGHNVGDLLLIETAHRLTRCVREVDIVARFGGDEFVVVINDLDKNKAKSASQASIIAEKILAALDEPYTLKIRTKGKAETTVEHHCTASIGVVLFINHEASAEDILKWADMAMYQAKEAGRNQIRFYEPEV